MIFPAAEGENVIEVALGFLREVSFCDKLSNYTDTCKIYIDKNKEPFTVSIEINDD